MLQTAARAGARMALCGVPGHALLASEAGLEVHGSYRCNVYNPYSADVLKEMQFTRVCVSPELCVAQIRDLQISLPKGAVVYGRLPLMTLRRCLLHDAPGGCAKCRAATGRGRVFLFCPWLGMPICCVMRCRFIWQIGPKICCKWIVTITIFCFSRKHNEKFQRFWIAGSVVHLRRLQPAACRVRIKNPCSKQQIDSI